jgi:hypothetical protein
MLVDEGFGVFGDWHDLTIQGKGGPKTGRSNKIALNLPKDPHGAPRMHP